MKISLDLPVNQTSLGSLGALILREIFERENSGDNSIDWYFFPIGGVDLSTQTNLPPIFNQWLNQKVVKTLESYTRDIPVFRLWHLNGSNQSFSSKKQSLLSFYELDNPTKTELNTAKINNTLFTSKYTQSIFDNFGVKTEYLPLPFDSYNFQSLGKKYHTDGRIVFNVVGKFENRKSHVQIIQSWIKKYGNNPKYNLQCAIYNNFINEQQNQQIIAQIINNNKPFNVNFYPFFKKNSEYNDFLNSANVVIGLGTESYGLPEFTSVAMGKYGIILNANGYKSWANENNTILVNPNGKKPAYDGMFFHQGQIYNQGNIFTWGEDEFISACELAIKKVESNPINTEGLKLQQQFNKKDFVDNIIKYTKDNQ